MPSEEASDRWTRAQAALRLQTAMSSPPLHCAGGIRQVPRIGIRLALLQFRGYKSSGTAQRAVSEVGTKIGKLLSTTETHFVGPARNREWPADVAVPATKDPVKDVSYSMGHDLTC